MFQKGPGEGYQSAKDDVLSVEPRAVCKRETRGPGIVGYVVYVGQKVICSAASARECWNKALGILK